MYLSNLCALITIVGSAATYVYASVAITAPLGSTWKAGTTNIITWTDNSDGKPMPAKFDIALMQGKLTSLQLVGSVVAQVDSSAGQYSWNIPANQAPAKDYSIRIGTPPDVAYSPYFEVTGPNGEQGSGAAPGTSGVVASTSGSPNQPTQSNNGGNGNTGAATTAAATNTPSTTHARSGATTNTALHISTVAFMGYLASQFV